ncbi:MAG: PspC domain-containing protein [Candidatus Portnoybacteria bacterium]|nr:PspC domain-containing protein [Candidatus Portnoybacteria bacterium]MDD4983125.1 PspC domain-containing protein [Candidatus Portnoybacteria bacterium]
MRGVAEYFGVDSTVVRLLFILVVAIGGSGVLLYALMWLLMPAGPKEEALITEEKIKEFAGELKDKAQEFKEEIAKRHNDADGHRHNGHGACRHNFFGWFLLILGIAFLLNNFVPSWMRLQMLKFWPLILIAAAVVLIARPGKEK